MENPAGTPIAQSSTTTARNPAERAEEKPYIPAGFDPSKIAEFDFTGHNFAGPVAAATGGEVVETRDVRKMDEQRAIFTGRDIIEAAEIKEPEAPKTREEMIAATIESLERNPKTREIFYKLLVFCQTETTREAAEAHIASLPEYFNCLQQPYVFLRALLRDGALEEIAYDAEGNEITAQERQALINHIKEEYRKTPQYCRVVEAERARLAKASLEAASAIDPDLPEEEDFDIDEPEELQWREEAANIEVSDVVFNDYETALEDAIEDALDDLIDHTTIRLTEVGWAVAEQYRPEWRLRAKLDENPDDRGIFLSVLELLAQGPHRMPEIEESVKAHPDFKLDSHGIPVAYPSYYTNMLAASGGITWSSAEGWSITEEGRTFLDAATR